MKVCAREISSETTQPKDALTFAHRVRLLITLHGTVFKHAHKDIMAKLSTTLARELAPLDTLQNIGQEYAEPNV